MCTHVQTQLASITALLELEETENQVLLAFQVKNVKFMCICSLRWQVVMVEPKHVALQSISEDSEGRLQFYIYVQLEQGIINIEFIQNALKVQIYLNSKHIKCAMLIISIYVCCNRERNRSTSIV